MDCFSNHRTYDQLDYLHELVDDYDQKLTMNSWSHFHNFIKEEKYKCMHQIRKLKEIQIEGIIMAQTSALVFPTIS